MRLFDSNILIYEVQPQHAFLRDLIAADDGAVSAISLVEVLGFPGISDEQVWLFEQFFQGMVIFPLDDAVLRRAITLRRGARLKLGDSLIAASAMEHDCELVTRNVSDFVRIPQLRVFNPFTTDPA